MKKSIVLITIYVIGLIITAFTLGNHLNDLYTYIMENSFTVAWIFIVALLSTYLFGFLYMAKDLSKIELNRYKDEQRSAIMNVLDELQQALEETKEQETISKN